MKIIVGLECHVTINKGVKTKLFCGCALPPEEAKPNTYTCPTCLALPGAKPRPNKRVIEQAVKVALALHCTIQSPIIFSRKTYFYPDLPSNYQRTQYEVPLGKNGYLMLDSGKKIRIERIHIEEDPGALIHQGSITLIDYNRSGTPLCEIVTDPDLSSGKEAREFLNKLQTIVEYIEIFDPITGTLKADANVNIPGHLHTEIKNIGGFKDIEDAIEYEAKRQAELDSPIKIRETRRWDPEKKMTIFMRSKEGEADYGYIADTDLVPITITKAMQEQEMPELPEQKKERYSKELKLKGDDAHVIISNVSLMRAYEEAIKKIDPQFAAEWMRREVTRVLTYNKKELQETFIAQHVGKIMQLMAQKRITRQTGQKLMEVVVNQDINIEDYVRKNKLELLEEIDDLVKICKETIQEQQDVIAEIKKGNEKAKHFLVGQIMRKTKGKAEPNQVQEILKELL